MARNNPTVNHLFFVDNSIIFCRAKIKEWLEIQKVLDIYEAVAGQGINKPKSEVFLALIPIIL